MMSELNVSNDSIDRWSRDKDIILELINPEVFLESKLQVDKINIRFKSSNVEEQEPGERTTSVSTSSLIGEAQYGGYRVRL
ncbi:MAG: hypothetical protein COC06_08070 [Bacteroidales bacterium]|nr:MAG: hypothetical protein COC06_08070 [Bacteroidales bacterium]